MANVKAEEILEKNELHFTESVSGQRLYSER